MSDIYWLNEDSRLFLERGYLLEGETPEQRIRDNAEAAEKILRHPKYGNPSKFEGFADKFELYLKRGWYTQSSPIWSNFGRERGLPISCFGSYIPDTMEGILEKSAEVGVMTKGGGGTSGFFGDIRGRGSKISSGGESTGSVHFMQIFDKLMQVVSQGNVRRGSFASYLPVDHPDIEEFLKIKSEGDPIQDISIGVCISDEWMKSMIAGDKDKRKVWASIIKKKFESGYPYIFFSDNANSQSPKVYRDKGLKIKHSNLCVTGDQRVVSSFGLLTAKELYESQDSLILFDNSKVVNASTMQLIEKDADVYKITLENGMSHTITGYHKIAIKDKISQKKDSFQEVLTKNVECKDLKIGDSVAIQTNKGLFGNVNKPKEAFLLGLYQADGTQHKDLIMLDLWENDFDLLPVVQVYHDYVCDTYRTQISKYNGRTYDKPKFIDCVVREDSAAKKRLTSKALKKALNFEKGYVPDWIWTADEETQWQYIRGLYYADGTVFKSKSSGEPIQISLASINKEFLQEIQLILANLGMQSSIRLLRAAGNSLMPDGKGGEKYYETKTCYRLIIGNKNDAITFNKSTHFLDRKGIVLEDREYRDNTKKFYKISSIEYVGKEDVYCCTVNSEEHHWICNGFVTHNCSEIMLSNDENESFVCNLSSINLEKWDEWKDTDAVETLVFFLDAVMTEFINKTEGMKFMEAARNFAINQRALGIGVVGWHSLLQSKMISFESMEAKYLNSEIWKTMRLQADEATGKLSAYLGEPKLLKGYGRRNVTTLAVAPTTSSAFILGQVSPSIEPLMDNYFVKDLAKSRSSYRNPYLKKLLESKGMDNEEVWLSILKKGGSVQHLEFLSQKERSVFKTFSEISQKEIIIQASTRQRWIDQGQSLNLRIHKDTKPKEVSELMIFAWEQGIKSLYYQRGTNPAQELSRSIMDCKNCEA
jgi:ribonucleoside-diphosphate reductase alpha chain